MPLVVLRLDRLARSLRDLQNIAHVLREKQVNLRVLEQAIDTGTPEGRMFFGMLGAIAEFETELRKARQSEGIAAAKAKGPLSPFKGRPATIDTAKVKALRAEGLSPTAISKKLGTARSSVYRLLEEGGQAA
jgi:DNA invertase Pin-like site-specific DNA recombinase